MVKIPISHFRCDFLICTPTSHHLFKPFSTILPYNNIRNMDVNAPSASPSDILPLTKAADELSISSTTTHQRDSIFSTETGGTSNTDDSPPSEQWEPYIRVCPHQTLTFGQFNEIAASPLSGNNKSLDILVKFSNPHLSTLDQTEITAPGPHERIVNSISGADTMETRSEIPFLRPQLSPVFESGFVLNAYWEILFYATTSPGNYQKPIMRNLLLRSNVWLCPHTKMWGKYVLNTLFALLVPNESDDEIYRPHTGAIGEDRINCPRCDTAISVVCLTKYPERSRGAKCLVKVRRYLGKGQNEKDPAWAKQCTNVYSDKGCGNDIDAYKYFSCKLQYLRGIINPSQFQKHPDPGCGMASAEEIAQVQEQAQYKLLAQAMKEQGIEMPPQTDRERSSSS